MCDRVMRIGVLFPKFSSSQNIQLNSLINFFFKYKFLILLFTNFGLQRWRKGIYRWNFTWEPIEYNERKRIYSSDKERRMKKERTTGKRYFFCISDEFIHHKNVGGKEFIKARRRVREYKQKGKKKINFILAMLSLFFRPGVAT